MKKSLKQIAVETVELLERGTFSFEGRAFEFTDVLSNAISNTKVWKPDELPSSGTSHETPEIEVTSESTQIAASRLSKVFDHVGILNFASAKNPGGGFLRGAKAQEEDLARCSGLHPCLSEAGEYYAANRASKSMLYTDFAVTSPRVPFFRTSSVSPPNELFEVSVVTSPAPNAGEYLRRFPTDQASVDETYLRRARQVLSLFNELDCDALVLGAWGCGVFRNDAEFAAKIFATLIEEMELTCRHICFAVYGKSKPANLVAFRNVFEDS